MDCLFCEIVAGDVSAHIVTETPDLVAFLDHRPLQKGHVLLVPRRHIATLFELPADLHAPFLAAGQRLAGAMVTGLGAEGSFVAINNVVSQSVPHLHLHVVPRRRRDGLKGFFWPRHSYAAGEQETYAARIRAALGASPASDEGRLL